MACLTTSICILHILLRHSSSCELTLPMLRRPDATVIFLNLLVLFRMSKILHYSGGFFECVVRGFMPFQLPKLFNRLTEITLEIDLGNLDEAEVALCLFQNAPNLRYWATAHFLGFHGTHSACPGINTSSGLSLPEPWSSWYDQLYWVLCRARLLETFTWRCTHAKKSANKRTENWAKKLSRASWRWEEHPYSVTFKNLGSVFVRISITLCKQKLPSFYLEIPTPPSASKAKRCTWNITFVSFTIFGLTWSFVSFH